MYFDSEPGNGVAGAKKLKTRVNPLFWAQFPRGYSYANAASTDGTLTGSVFLIEFNGNAGDIPQPEIITYSDGHRATITPSDGHLFTNVWTDGQRAESVDYFSNLCPKLTVRIDSSYPNYHFITGFSGREKMQLMECLGDADTDSGNNWVIPGTMGKSWDHGSAFFPHIVRMVRVATDVDDSGFYVALYYDTSVQQIDGGGYGDTLERGQTQGTFKLLHPFESLDRYEEVQYYIYTTKGTLQVAGNKTEAAFDFASKEFFTTNQSHIIDYGVYWRVNETQTVELGGTDVDEVQVVQTAQISSPDKPEIQTVTVKVLRVLPVQEIGVTVKGAEVAAALSSYSCVQGSKCDAFQLARFSGALTFRFDPSQCGQTTKPAVAGNTVDTNFCRLAMDSMVAKATLNAAYYCPLDSDCVSATADLTAASVKSAICGIKGKTVNGVLGTVSFTLDDDNNCVTVTESSTMTASDSYTLKFRIEFDSKNLQSDIPALVIYSSTVLYTKLNAALKFKYYTHEYVSDSLGATQGCGIVNPVVTGAPLYDVYYGTGLRVMKLPSPFRVSACVVSRGNQPDGYYKLSYSCPAKWTLVQVVASRGTAKGDHRANQINIATSYNMQLRLNHVFRDTSSNTYHRVVALDATCTYAACTTATVDPPINTKIAQFARNVELGVFYSDPFKSDHVWSNGVYVRNPFGVSDQCLRSHIRWTDALSTMESPNSFKTQLTAVINQLSPYAIGPIGVQYILSDPAYAANITVVRTLIDLHASCTIGTNCYIGYVYTITFTSAHGDGLPLGTLTYSAHATDQINIWPTTVLGPTPTVTVATTQDGGMIHDGYFQLSQTYPHSYLGTPASFSVDYIRWNALPSELQAQLSASTLAFGSVKVTRSPYMETGTVRWTGGYMWTITFTNRNGKLPKMGIANSLTLTASGTARAVVGSGDSALAIDDPGVAVSGNQVGGSFGFSFTDPLGTTYTSSSTMFPVLSATTGLPLTADEFRTKLNTMLGSKRITSVKVTRSGSVNAVMGYTYTVEFQGKDLRGDDMALQPITTSLTKTSSTTSSNVWVSVSEAVKGRNDTVFNTQYDGEIACEAVGGVGDAYSACLSKGDLFVVLDPYNPAFNPIYLNLHKAVSVYSQDVTPYTPGLESMYPNPSLSERERLWTYKRFVVKSDIATNWAQDTEGQATFRFYKFTPHKDSTYHVVSECSNRGTCNAFEGVCDCFHGFSGDSCAVIDSMSI